MSDPMTSSLTAMTAFGRRIGQRVRDFARAETGTVTVESVIILPVILFGLQATFAYYDAYRRQSQALKANYAVSDFLSRFPSYDRATLEGLDEMFQYMTQTSEASWVRVTVVKCNRNCTNEETRKLGRVNSKVSLGDGVSPLTRDQMRLQLGPVIPMMYQGENLIVVETVAKYVPPFWGAWTGIYPRDFYDVIVTSPREAETLCWKKEPADCPVPTS
ncbi:hypothetical protein [uncultured Aliiroseovarius sp.]|uniref:TadE/TadG family type IV pilus assembly protein n=1 Tax=uncultured Aliiroseovarius sp. TaxID=1658783 RepID=UPI00260570BC|nr:hypothetical protein [uncultured Aliiroseovarius sp.]